MNRSVRTLLMATFACLPMGVGCGPAQEPPTEQEVEMREDMHSARAAEEAAKYEGTKGTPKPTTE